MVVVILFGFSGCSMFDFFAAENLLKAPKLTGEKAELQIAFEQAVGADISLYTPIAGDNRASYILFDANADGNEEAVVFYSYNSNSSVVHMHLLSQKNGEWYSVDDFIGSGTEVYKVDFYNIDGSRNLEIAVIWSLEDSKKEKTLSVYRISSLESNFDYSIVSLATIQIADYIYCDVDSDGANELLYFYFDSSYNNSSVNVRLLDFDSQENNLVPLSEVTLPFVFSSVLQITYDKENDDYRFYIDCISADGSVFSEIIVFSSENAALFIPVFKESYASSETVRASSVLCSDFNGDGYLDIPVNLSYDDSYAVADVDGTSPSLSFVHWYTYLDGEFRSLGKYFVNDYDGYCLKLDSLYEYYYVVYDYVNKVTQIRLKNFDEENNIIFSITCKGKSDDTVSIIPDGFLGDSSANEYNVVISAKGESMNFTESFIKNLISDL